MNWSLTDASNRILGIGTKSVQNLQQLGISTVEQLKNIVDPQSVAGSINIPVQNLNCAMNIVNALGEEFLSTVQRQDLDIVQKVAGVNIELGVALWAQGIRKLEDITSTTQIDFSKLPARFGPGYWRKIVFSTQLDLIPGLTRGMAWQLAHRSGLGSLQDFVQNLSISINGVSSDLMSKWRYIAGKQIEKNILDFRTANNLRLVKKIRGIGPQIGTMLACLDIVTETDLIRADFSFLKGYIPFLQEEDFLSWVVQAFNIINPRCILCDNLMSALQGMDRNLISNCLEAFRSFAGGNLNMINNSRQTIIQTLSSKKTDILDELLHSSKTDIPFLREGLRRSYDSVFNFTMEKFSSQGGSFLSSLLNSAKDLVMHPDNLSSIAQSLGIDSLIPSSNSLSISSSKIHFVVGRGKNDSATLTLEEDDQTKTLKNINVTSSVDWLILDTQSVQEIQGGTSRNINFTVSIPETMNAGNYQGLITVTAKQYIKETNQLSRDSDQYQTVAISLQVPTGTMYVSNSDLNFGDMNQDESQTLNFQTESLGQSAITGISLQVRGDYSTWLNVQPLSIASLAGGQTETVSAVLSIPDDRYTWGPHNWSIDVRGDEGGIERLINVNARVNVERAWWWVLLLVVLIIVFLVLLTLCICAILTQLGIPILGWATIPITISICLAKVPILFALINWLIM